MSENTVRWAALLKEAVEKPGMIMQAYSRFHGYSFGNQITALSQCLQRGITPGPIATFKRWAELGRSVKKGEKAITLCMPINIKDESDEDKSKTIFVWKPRWFVLVQTEGEPYASELVIPEWDKATALSKLEIKEVEFERTDGNVQGYAKVGSIAINPLAQLPFKTLFHELGHVLLGHCEKGAMDHAEMPKTLIEAEAEAVALCCLEALGLPGTEYARGYIQHWYGSGNPLPDSSASRIFKTVDTILKAGAPGKDN